MIIDILEALVAIVIVIVLWAVCIWFIQREPAGKGQRGTRDAGGDAPLARPFRHEPRHAQTVTLPVTDALVPVAATAGDPPWESDTAIDVPGPDGARRRAASKPAMAVMPAAVADEPLYPLEMTRVAVARAGDLAPWVAAALAKAAPDQTVIDVDHASLSRWLEAIVGGDPFDGKGSGDDLVEWLFAGTGARS